MLEPHVSKRLASSEHRIVITGATGWLGRSALELLEHSLASDFHSRVLCFGSRSRTIELSSGTAIEQKPLSALGALSAQPTFLLHFAFLTKERAEAMDEGEYRTANDHIRRTVLEALDTIGCDGLFIASSGAAHFAEDKRASRAMQLYGLLKREDEQQFASWAQEHAKTIVISRIHNLSGAHINKTTSYALACFILDGLAGRPIAVRAGHEVWRGYVAVRELLSLVFAMLLEGKTGTRLFDSGGVPIELGALAEAVASQLGSPRPERAIPTGKTSDRYLGDDLSYRSLLQTYDISAVSLEQQIAETIDFLRKTGTSDNHGDSQRQPSHGSAEAASDSVPGGSAPL